MKTTLLAGVFAIVAPCVFAAPQTYVLDPTHSQAVFSFSHAGFSNTTGMFSGFEGGLALDRDDLSASSIKVQIAADQMLTGFQPRDDHFLKSDDFFKLKDFPLVSFASTSVKVTGEKTALVTGDMTINGVTKTVVLDTVLNAETDSYPFPPMNGKPAVGFDATASILRSDFDLGMFVPYVGDEVKIQISIEAIDPS